MGPSHSGGGIVVASLASSFVAPEKADDAEFGVVGVLRLDSAGDLDLVGVA